MEPVATAVPAEIRREALSRFYSIGALPGFIQRGIDEASSSTSTRESKRKRYKKDKERRKAHKKSDHAKTKTTKSKKSDVSDKENANITIGSESCRFGKPIRPVNQSTTFDRSARFAASCYRSYASFLGELANPKEVTYNNPRHQVRGLNGNARFARIKEALEGFENKPIELQMRMHQAAFSVEGPLIWGEEYFNNTKLILEREGWTAKISLLFVLTQRKMGKTYFLGQHAIIHALNPRISDFRIACISRTLDQAILTVAIARKLFATHAWRRDYSLTVNQVKRIEISRSGMSAEIRAYSGNPDVRIPIAFSVKWGWLETTKAPTLGWFHQKEKKIHWYNTHSSPPNR